MLSIVVPVFNEADSLEMLHAQIVQAAEQDHYDFELILIDDGSSDGSWSIIQRLAEKDTRVGGIRFRRNFGKADALSAGAERAGGDIIITMDADLQDDPREIPKLLAKLDAGFDVVSGWKQVRHDPWHKVYPSRVFNWLVSTLTGVRLHDHNCGLKAYRREIFNEVKLYGEMHRFVPVLAAARGWKVSEVAVEHHARRFGSSKYGFARFVKGFLDLLTVCFLTGYRQRPQHLLGTIGLSCFVFGLLGMISLTIAWVVSRMTQDPIHLHQRAIFYYSMTALLLGVQLVGMGFLAELITALHRPTTHTYSIAARTGRCTSADAESVATELQR